MSKGRRIGKGKEDEWGNTQQPASLPLRQAWPPRPSTASNGCGAQADVKRSSANGAFASGSHGPRRCYSVEKETATTDKTAPPSHAANRRSTAHAAERAPMCLLSLTRSIEQNGSAPLACMHELRLLSKLHACGPHWDFHFSLGHAPLSLLVHGPHCRASSGSNSWR